MEGGPRFRYPLKTTKMKCYGTGSGLSNLTHKVKVTTIGALLPPYPTIRVLKLQ